MLFDSRIGRYGLQTAKVAAVAALSQRIYLDMPDLPDVAVAAEKDVLIDDDPGAVRGAVAPGSSPGSRGWRRSSVRPAPGCEYRDR